MPATFGKCKKHSRERLEKTTRVPGTLLASWERRSGRPALGQEGQLILIVPQERGIPPPPQCPRHVTAAPPRYLQPCLYHGACRLMDPGRRRWTSESACDASRRVPSVSGLSCWNIGEHPRSRKTRRCFWLLEGARIPRIRDYGSCSVIRAGIAERREADKDGIYVRDVTGPARRSVAEYAITTAGNALHASKSPETDLLRTCRAIDAASYSSRVRGCTDCQQCAV